jgi:hypothetical protein
LIAWSRHNGQFSYAKLWSNYAKALLEPWARNVEPTPEHKTKIINDLIAYAGDPRTGSKTKWSKLDGTTAKGVILKWLTRASVLQFLDIVDRTAEVRMWSYRRAFWTSYLLANYIDEAWVAFGDNGASLAIDAAKRTNDESLAQFGRVIRGTGKTPDHAALIMKIGDLIITDWSHNGKYNIWPKGYTKAPVLFQGLYSARALSDGPISGAHMNAEGLHWQRKIAQEIAKHTSRRVTSDHWTPSRRR